MTDEPTVTDAGSESEEDATSKNTEEKPEEVQEEQPKENSKKRPRDFILDRKNKKIERLEQELSEAKEEQDLINPTQDDSVDGKIEKAIKRHTEVNEFLKKYPELEEDKPKIMAYLEHDSRKGIPVEEVIISAVGVDKFLKIGANMKANADKDAQANRMGGGEPSGEPTTQESKIAEQYNDKSTLPRFFQ